MDRKEFESRYMMCIRRNGVAVVTIENLGDIIVNGRITIDEGGTTFVDFYLEEEHVGKFPLRSIKEILPYRGE